VLSWLGGRGSYYRVVFSSLSNIDVVIETLATESGHFQVGFSQISITKISPKQISFP
jgi:hypothetical protein